MSRNPRSLTVWLVRRVLAWIGSPVSLGMLSLAGPILAHEHTAHRFHQQQLAAAAQAAHLGEPAPDPREGVQVCRLKLELVTVDGRPAPAALVRITNLATGKALSFPDEIHRGLNWHAIENGATLPVPPGKLRIEAFRGLASERAVRELDLGGQPAATATIPLTRFHDAGARGMRAGNTHLHLRSLTREQADRYRTLVPQADELDLVFLSHLEREPEDRTYVSNGYTRDDLERLSRDGVRFGNGEEHRHDFGPSGEGYGRVMFLDVRRLIQPVSIGPGLMKKGTDGLPLQHGIRQARADGATVIWCHNKLGHEDLPNWVAGLLHAQNIFDGGSEGDYADTFYRYLDVGLKVPFSSGTDWFIEDFARVYVELDGAWTARGWLEALVQGRSGLDHRLRVTEPGWIVLRIPTGAGSNELGKPLFAHTSPVYLEIDGRRRFRPAVARGIWPRWSRA